MTVKGCRVLHFFQLLAVLAILLGGCTTDDSFVAAGTNGSSSQSVENSGSEEVVLLIDPVTGEEVPPDPGEAGWEGEGIDSDGDGLRDDVQRWLAVNYGTKFTLEEYRIAKTYAILVQRALLYSDDKDKALNLVAEKHILWDALNYLRVEKKLRDFKQEGPGEAAIISFLQERLDEMDAFSRGVEEAVVNTNFRYITYREFDSLLGGEVFSFASGEKEFLRALVASKNLTIRELERERQ